MTLRNFVGIYIDKCTSLRKELSPQREKSVFYFKRRCTDEETAIYGN